MDKNKSRSDLLKAGRKKLQQFREKKDGKGGSSSSHGKSSKKSSKMDRQKPDTESAYSPIPQDEDVPHVDNDILVVKSDAVENSLSSETDVAAVHSSPVAITPEVDTVDASFSHDAELLPQESKVGSEDAVASLDIKESGMTVDTEESSFGVAITPEAGTVDPSFSHDAELPPQESKVGSEDSMRSLGIKESGETVDTEELSVGVIITPEAGTVDASFAHDAVLSSQESKVEGENPISGLDAEESGQIVDIMESRIGVITPEEVTIDASYVKDANLPPQESTACDEGGAAADIDTMESKAGELPPQGTWVGGEDSTAGLDIKETDQIVVTNELKALITPEVGPVDASSHGAELHPMDSPIGSEDYTAGLDVKERCQIVDPKESMVGGEFGSKAMELTELQQKIQQLNVLKIELENEVLAFKESLAQTEEAHTIELLVSSLVQKYEEATGMVSSSREEFTNTIQKLVGVVESVVILDNFQTQTDIPPAMRLELLVSLLVQKYREASEQVSTSAEVFSNNMQKLVGEIEAVVNLEHSMPISESVALRLESLVHSLVQRYKEVSEMVNSSSQEFSSIVQKSIQDIEGVIDDVDTVTNSDNTPTLHLELLASSLVQKYNEASEQVSSSRKEFMNTIQKLVGDIESVVILENIDTGRDITPAIRLELLVALLVQKYKEASEQASSSTEVFSKTMEKLVGDIEDVVLLEESVLDSESVALRLESFVSSLIQHYKEASEKANSSAELTSTVQKSIEDIEGVLDATNTEAKTDATPALRLELLVASLVQKYKEASEQASSSKEEFMATIQKLVGDIESVVVLEKNESESDIAPAVRLGWLVSVLIEKYKEASEQWSTSTEVFSNTMQKLAGDIETVVHLENSVHDSESVALHLESLVSSLIRHYKEVNEKAISSVELTSTVEKSIEDIEGVLDVTNSDASPALRLDLLVSSLVQKYKEACEQVSSSKEEFTDTIQKLVGDIENVVLLEEHESESDIAPAVRLGRLVSVLVEKYKEASEQWSTSTEVFSNTMQKLSGDIEAVVQLEDSVLVSESVALHLESLVSSLIQHYKEVREKANLSAELTSTIQKSIEDIEGVLDVTQSDASPALRLDLLVSSLVQKYNESCEQVSSSKEEFIDTIQKLVGDIESVVLLEKNESEIDVAPAVRLGWLVSILVEKYKEASEERSASIEVFSNTMQKLAADIEAVVQLEDSVLDSESVALRLESLVSSLIQHYKEVSEKANSSIELTSAVQKSIEDIEGLFNDRDTEINSDITPALRLELLVSSLVQKYKGAYEQVCKSSEEFGSKAVQQIEVQEKAEQFNVQNLELGNEVLALKESLTKAEESLAVARSELQEKTSELEQSDQRVSSIREKLGIAVGKGKALVVQRDSLKQSLAEKSKELEICSQELQVKDARLHELETDLKAYMEAGERVEALESELSYIRNSATALRESFLLKDSVLQRVEEILEELDLPENFHSRGTIEKVEWLARSAAVNSLSVNDWDQKSVGGSYSDASFSVKDAWKEDATPTASGGDDLRRKYEELQNKFYGLAEQTEMLEQSLMQRNYMIQRWEDVLDKMNMPSHLRSMEPEGKIEWLGRALSEAEHDRSSLLQKIDKLEHYSGLVTTESEELQKRMSELEADLQAVLHEREQLSERLEILAGDHEKNLSTVAQLELENKNLQDILAEKVHSEERIQSIEAELHKLEGLVIDALQEPVPNDAVSGECGTEYLEALLRKFIDQYSVHFMEKPVPIHASNGIQTSEVDDGNLDELRSREIVVTEKPDVVVLEKDLEEALDNLMHVKVERDVYMERQQALISEIETFDKKMKELQQKLMQEEQKSASVREKLNVAVRKGKQLVQQRDSLKHSLEEMNNDLGRLKSEISRKDDILVNTEQKIRDLSTYPQMVETLESEKLFLRNRLSETEHVLQEREYALSSTLHALADIDVGGQITVDDPIEKLRQIGKLLHDLHVSATTSEQESRKSRRAAELLLAELNEVQERNDSLQEELAKAGDELAEISKEKSVAEAAKFEALSHLEKLSAVYSEGKQKQFHELTELKTNVNELKMGVSDVNLLLADVFSKDFELLHNLEASMESCLKQHETSDKVDDLPILRPYSENKNFLTLDSSWSSQIPEYFDDSTIVEISNSVSASLQELKTDIGRMKGKLHEHPVSLHETATNISNVMDILRGEIISLRKSLESLKRDFTQVESVEKEKEMEIIVLRRNISLLYEACTNSIREIVNKQAELEGNNSAVGELPSSGEVHVNSEEHVKAIADKLSSTVKDFAVMRTENDQSNLKEMKATIADLQRELQEKDIQKDRICSELVVQIKGAEAAAQGYLHDLRSEKAQLHEKEEQLKAMEEEQSLLNQRLKELQNEQAISEELQEKVKSLTELLPAKDQEIEALMQALEEEEIQMEELKNKIEELEKLLQQKNLDLQNVEASRGKIAKKLSVTVTKFDELHHLSESLLAEVEKLQSQLQERDAEISFLRQEVTRCTNEVLAASQINKKDSDEIQEILSWVDARVSQIGLHDLHTDDESSLVKSKELLQKKISAIISEFEDLRVAARSSNVMLQAEKSKVQALTLKEEALRKSLSEKDAQLNMLEDLGDSGQQKSSLTSEILEVEPVINKWTVPGASTTSQVRSLRKANNDQVAIAIDTEADGSRIEDEDDDKVHGFKSLTTSRFIPKFTRPVSDTIDGLWVSCDRALMRQPASRLFIIVYWAFLHLFLAHFMF